MSTASAAQAAAAGSSMAAGAPETRLPDGWLAYARVAFVALVALVVALNLVVLPDLYASQLTPDVLRQLRQQGVSPTLYAALSVAESIVTTFTYVTLGALVFWRRSDDRVALFCAVMLVTFGGVAATPLDDITGGSPMPQPLGGVPILRAVVYLLVVVGQASFVTFFYLFPAGRFVPRWTRWCALLCLVYWLAVAYLPPLAFIAQGNLIFVFWLVAVVAQIYRYRHVSTPVEREQTKWIVFGLVVAFVIILVPALVTLLLPPDVANALSSSNFTIWGILINLRWAVALLLIPIVIAVAVTRAHLWDIDVLINRALVYGALTALLALVYVACVAGTQLVAQALTGRRALPAWVIVASTLLIAALFQPLRRRLQAGIDRRFFRGKYDAAAALASFGSALRGELDLAQLDDRLVSVVSETMQPAHVSLWLRDPPPPSRPDAEL